MRALQMHRETGVLRLGRGEYIEQRESAEGDESGESAQSRLVPVGKTMGGKKAGTLCRTKQNEDEKGAEKGER